MRQVSAGKVEPYETTRLHKDGRSVPALLSVSAIYDACGVIVGASKIAHDISARRVKNLFAAVLAISRQTLGHGQIDAANVRSFEARLSSMARAHDLLTHRTWEQAELRAIVEQSISPYFPDRFAVTGLQSRSLQGQSCRSSRAS